MEYAPTLQDQVQSAVDYMGEKIAQLTRSFDEYAFGVPYQNEINARVNNLRGEFQHLNPDLQEAIEENLLLVQSRARRLSNVKFAASLAQLASVAYWALSESPMPIFLMAGVEVARNIYTAKVKKKIDMPLRVLEPVLFTPYQESSH